MKKLEIIIRPQDLEELKTVLEEHEVNGINMVNIMGYGNQKGFTKFYRGSEFPVNLLPKIKVETVVSDRKADELIPAILDKLKTGNVGDGKIFVHPIEDAYRIRTGEHGEDALK